MKPGTRLADLRKEYGYTQKEVASLLHISKSTLSNYERSIHFPPYEIFVQLCQIYRVSADYVLGRTDSRMEIDLLNQKLPYGYTIGSCMDLILNADREYQAHLLKYFEYTRPDFRKKK